MSIKELFEQFGYSSEDELYEEIVEEMEERLEYLKDEITCMCDTIKSSANCDDWSDVLNAENLLKEYTREYMDTLIAKWRLEEQHEK